MSQRRCAQRWPAEIATTPPQLINSQGENKRLLGPASAGEQYHAEGLYKDRSAFIPRSYNGSTALKREKVRGGERSASG